MLRIFKLIPIITITFNLLSCQEIEKITLFKGDISFKYNERDIYAAYRLTEDSLSFFIDHDFSFPLFVYVPGCGSCEFSSLLVSDYIRETEAIFPYAIYGDFTDCGLEGVVNNSIVFFNQGNIVEIYDITDENTDSFKQKIADITDKLTAMLGEAKAAIEKKISDKLKDMKKKLFGLFGLAQADNEEDEEVKRIEEQKLIHEENTTKETLFQNKKIPEQTVTKQESED